MSGVQALGEKGECGSGVGAGGAVITAEDSAGTSGLWSLFLCPVGPQYLFQRDLPRASDQIWSCGTCLPNHQPPQDQG